MTSVAERVKEFIETWDRTHCTICEDSLQDGKFIMIDGKLYCLTCHEFELNKPNKPNEHKGHV